MSLSSFLPQYPICFICLRWMVCEMGGKWPYNCCFIECCFQGLFEEARRIILRFFVCLYLQLERTWHKVNDPKVDYSGGWGRGKSGLSRDSNPAWLCWTSSPARRRSSWYWKPFGLESVLWTQHRAKTRLTVLIEFFVQTFLRSIRAIMEVPVDGGARGVMVIVVGNGHSDSSSNPGRDWLHFI